MYATLAKGSRPGGFNLPIPLPSAEVLAINPYAYNCAAGAVTAQSQPNYTPDSVWSVEVGEKARFDDRRITVNADVYYVKWTRHPAGDRRSPAAIPTTPTPAMPSRTGRSSKWRR